MNSDTFIPESINELYKKMTDDGFTGELSIEDDWLIWKLPNRIIIKTALNNHPGEGYIEISYFNGKKESSLTHWHPFEDEIYKDLLDINSGQTFWVRKKSNIFNYSFRSIITIDKCYWDKLSEKRRNKYDIVIPPIDGD